MDSQNPQNSAETTQQNSASQQPVSRPVEATGETSGGIKTDNNTLMAVLAYIGPLVIVSYLVAKDNPFVKFHIKQGLVLFVAEVVLWFLRMTFWQLWFIYSIIHFCVIILGIFGIVNAFQGKMKELPLVGEYGKHFNI